MGGEDFITLGIIGPQSSGKSTLLNKLFNTNFSMMKEGEDKQTTRGVFASCNDQKDVLILDIEGSDSIERDNQDGVGGNFEKKLAMFGLCMSDILLVNIESPEVTFNIFHKNQKFQFF